MAIPTLLRQTDYAGVDFTDKAQGTFEVLKDALVDKFGWTLLFEDLASPDKSFVVANTGSQSCLKITKEDSDTSYLKFEAAQSYSDINTPINLIQSGYYYIDYFDSLFYLVGDSKRFYFFNYISDLPESSYDSGSLFAGDVIPFAENNPEVFVLTPSRRNASQFDTSKSTYNSGTLGSKYIAPQLVNGQVDSTVKIFTHNGLERTILATGAADYMSSGYNNIDPATPCILNEAYLVNQYRSENGVLYFIGKLPGILYSVTTSDKVSNKNKGELVTINGQQCITFPHQNGNRYNKGVILLNDWDVL